MTDWGQFAEGPAEQLALLPSGAIVKVVASGRFAQFAQDDDSLVAHLIGDEHLDPVDRPVAERRRRIIDAGWQLPDVDHAGNWWIELPWPVMSSIYRRLAAMVVIGLRDGLGVGSPADLVYDAWNDKAGNEPMDLPLLGLPRGGARSFSARHGC